MEYWKAFDSLQALKDNNIWKGDKVPPLSQYKEWLEYLYIAEVKFKDSDNTDLQGFKIGWSNNIKDRMNQLKSDFNDAVLLYTWRLPAAQTFEKVVKDFLIQFGSKTTINDLTGSTEVIFDLDLVPLVHTMQLCVLYRASQFLTNREGVRTLNVMETPPDQISYNGIYNGRNVDLNNGIKLTEFSPEALFRNLNITDKYPKGYNDWSYPNKSFRRYIRFYSTVMVGGDEGNNLLPLILYQALRF